MEANTSRKIRFWLGIAIVSSCLGCDQATKSLATQTLKNTPPRSYLADTLRLEYALNSGGFLSLGGNLDPKLRQLLFVGLNTCFLGGLLWFLVRNWNIRLSIFVASASILAGGIGNLIDRITNQGLVTDFLVVGIGPIRSGIFNVADMAVTFGAIAIVCYSWQAPPSNEWQPESSSTDLPGNTPHSN